MNAAAQQVHAIKIDRPLEGPCCEHIECLITRFVFSFLSFSPFFHTFNLSLLSLFSHLHLLKNYFNLSPPGTNQQLAGYQIVSARYPHFLVCIGLKSLTGFAA